MLSDIITNIYNNLVNFITGQNAQDRFVNLLDSSPNILSDKDQADGYVGTNSFNEMNSVYYNENNTRANIITKAGLGELITGKFYQVSDAVGTTITLQVSAENAFQLHEFAIDVQTGEIGTYDITTDVFTVISGNANITPITAAALLALPSFSTTTIYIVTDAPYRIAIQAETTSQLGQTGTIVDDTYSGIVDYDLASNIFLNGTIYDGDGNIYQGNSAGNILATSTNNFFNVSSSNDLTNSYSNVFTLADANILVGSGNNNFGINSSSNNLTDSTFNTFELNCQNITIDTSLYNTFKAGVISLNSINTGFDYCIVVGGDYSGVDFTNATQLFGRSAIWSINKVLGADLLEVTFDANLSTATTGTYDTSTDTFTAIGGGGDLQTVTTAGNTTTTEIISQTVGVGKVRLDPNGALEINTGWSSAYLRATNVVSSDCDFEFPDYGPGTETLAMQSDLASYLPLTGGSLSGALNEAQGANIASATTTDIGAATGNSLTVTGTTTITGLGTVQAGTRRIVTFSGILILTHNGTSLILPTAANITTAVGDVATFVSLGSGNWFCASYQRASGAALVGGGTDTQVVLTGSDLLATVNDSASYHFGTQFAVMGGTAAQRTFKFTDAKTVTKASLSLFQTVNGSGETVNIFLRNETAGTDTAIGTFTSNFGASTALKTLYTGLSIAVNTTDDYCIKITTPAFATNPTNWIPSVLLSLT